MNDMGWMIYELHQAMVRMHHKLAARLVDIQNIVHDDPDKAYALLQILIKALDE